MEHNPNSNQWLYWMTTFDLTQRAGGRGGGWY